MCKLFRDLFISALPALFSPIAEEIKQREIVTVFARRRDVDEVIEYLRLKKEDIRTVSALGIANWGVKPDFLRELRNNDVELTLLCLNPEGIHVNNRTLEEDRPILAHLQTTIEEMRGAPELSTVHLFFYDKVPRFNIVLIGGRNEKKDSYAIVQHYSYIRGGSSPQFVIKKYGKKGVTTLYDYYQKIFKQIYDEASNRSSHISEEHQP